MIAQEKDIQQAIQNRVANNQGDFKKLAYQEDIPKNNFRNTPKRYGVRVLESSQIAGVTKHATFDHTFELVLTDQYFETNIDDNKKVEAYLNLRGAAYEVYKDLVKSKAGLPSQVINVYGLVLNAPEFITESKVVVQRAQMTVTARLSLV